MRDKPRFLVVGGQATFATSDVYWGLLRGLRASGVMAHGYPLFERTERLSLELCHREIHSLAMDRRYGFDYVVFVSSHHVPHWLPLSIQGPKCIGVSTEDPHIIDVSRSHVWYDVRTTNDKNGDYTAHYLPMAAEWPPVVAPLHEEVVATDIVFIGSIYKERIRFFERVEPFLRQRELRVRIMGNLPDRGLGITSISDWCESTRMSLPATLAYLRAAKVCLNLHRPSFHKRNYKNIVGHSTNPRSYECASVGAFMISDNERPEVREIFGDSVPVFSTPDEFCDMLAYYLDAEDERQEKAQEAQRIFRAGHTYRHRAQSLIRMLGIEDRPEAVPDNGDGISDFLACTEELDETTEAVAGGVGET